jgi:hypothetical protein
MGMGSTIINSPLFFLFLALIHEKILGENTPNNSLLNQSIKDLHTIKNKKVKQLIYKKSLDQKKYTKRKT